MLPLRNRHRSSRRASQGQLRTIRRGWRPVAELMESRTLLSITVVDTFDDVVNTADGHLSLREAITQAAATPGDDPIVLPHEIDSVVGTYALALGELAID